MAFASAGFYPDEATRCPSRQQLNGESGRYSGHSPLALATRRRPGRRRQLPGFCTGIRASSGGSAFAE